MKISRLEVPPIGTNCYILMDEATQKAAVVDPGGGVRDIMTAIGDMGAQVESIFLTHAHYDHTGAVDAMRHNLPEVKVYLHPTEALSMGGDIAPPIANVTHYQEGDTIMVGELQVKVLHTPGHTVGGVCLVVNDAIFTGDSLFQGTMGRCDLPGGSYGQLLESLRCLDALEGDYQVLPGHMEPSTLNQERSYNPYMLEAKGH